MAVSKCSLQTDEILEQLRTCPKGGSLQNTKSSMRTNPECPKEQNTPSPTPQHKLSCKHNQGKHHFTPRHQFQNFIAVIFIYFFKLNDQLNEQSLNTLQAVCVSYVEGLTLCMKTVYVQE